jgi:hypothetical protein
VRRGVIFPARIDSAHWVPNHGMRAMYDSAILHGIGNAHRTARPQTSSRAVGLAQNMPALQNFGGPINLNAPHAVSSSRQAGGSSKWKAFDRA